jgi:hypothetical protein
MAPWPHYRMGWRRRRHFMKGLRSGGHSLTMHRDRHGRYINCGNCSRAWRIDPDLTRMEIYARTLNASRVCPGKARH